MGESITTARHGLNTLSTHCSGPSEIKLWDFLYSEWGDYITVLLFLEIALLRCVTFEQSEEV